ncbi:rhodanese-like domain-containing protein [Asaia astilbis]|uniref:rhodanese-like domain-containing protein n=1 Tax=Asaia astilbis TaxID=610244 RepID=UPI0004728B67|nr:rhodanese-like domain-containing protein [Asaia astilbis]
MTRTTTSEAVRAALREGREIALIDLREEGPFSRAHPLFAVNIPLSRLDLYIGALIPRGNAPIVVYDDGEGYASRALPLLAALGYGDVSVLEGGLEGWRASGGEIFIDVNVPSKAFGELVEHERQTPSLPAEELERRIAAGENIVILDARRFSEYEVMSIPQGRSVPGGDLAYRARDNAPSPDTTIVVNCAGRTRSIIGAQSLVNAALPNPVYALRNGTIGWTLAGFDVARGQLAEGAKASSENAALAKNRAIQLAEASGVRSLTSAEFLALQADPERTLYRLDVRLPEEFAAGHLSGFRSAPGGQLIQATEEWIAVRHGTIVLTDDDGVRARMAGHWLRQLGWNEVYILPEWDDLARETGSEQDRLPPNSPSVRLISPKDLAGSGGKRLIVDLAPSPIHRKGHVEGAVFASRAELATQLRAREVREVVLTSPDGRLAALAAPELAVAGIAVQVLEGGTDAWRQQGLPLASGLEEGAALTSTDDVYKRPYEGTDNAAAAMQAYLDWEFGLIAQLERDGTHNFRVLGPV